MRTRAATWVLVYGVLLSGWLCAQEAAPPTAPTKPALSPLYIAPRVSSSGPRAARTLAGVPANWFIGGNSRTPFYLPSAQPGTPGVWLLGNEGNATKTTPRTATDSGSGYPMLRLPIMLPQNDLVSAGGFQYGSPGTFETQYLTVPYPRLSGIPRLNFGLFPGQPQNPR